MIEALESLVAILREKGIKESTVVNATGINKTTVHAIYAGINDNPKLQTIIDIADYAGIRLVWETDQSKKAIDSGDISAYREMMVRRDRENDTLLQIVKSQRDDLDRKDQTIEELREELKELRGRK